MSKFIEISMTEVQKRTIAIDNIASVEPHRLTGAKITLKEVVDGTNVSLISFTSYRQIALLIKEAEEKVETA